MRSVSAFVIFAAVAVAAAVPASAAVTYTIACDETGELRQIVKEAVGNREQMQGFGSIVAWCPAKQELQKVPVPLEGDASATLNKIAAMPGRDDELVADLLEWSDADNGEGEAIRYAIGWNKEKTFGDLRAMLSTLAQPVGFVEDTGYRAYSTPQCADPVVPIRYYIRTKAPFPGCGGKRLIQEGAETSSWQ